MKRRFFAFSVCMAVLLASFTGCYSAQKDVTSVPSSSQTVQSGSASATENSVEIRTYDIPEENVQAGTRYVPSPTTGGFWMWTLFIQNYIQAYDPVTKSTIFRVIRQVASIAMHFARLILVRYPGWQSIGAISMP